MSVGTALLLQGFHDVQPKSPESHSLEPSSLSRSLPAERDRVEEIRRRAAEIEARRRDVALASPIGDVWGQPPEGPVLPRPLPGLRPPALPTTPTMSPFGVPHPLGYVPPSLAWQGPQGLQVEPLVGPWMTPR